MKFITLSIKLVKIAAYGGSKLATARTSVSKTSSHWFTHRLLKYCIWSFLIDVLSLGL